MPHTLDSIAKEWYGCTKCAIACHRNNQAFCEVIGNSLHMFDNVDILMIGEGPGKGEDVLGRPFIGASGRLLRDTIRTACGDDLTIGLDNLIICRPTDKREGPNRIPLLDEVAACRSRLLQVIEVTKPVAIVCLGSTPQQYVPPMLGGVRWNGLTWHIKHPAAVLRHGGADAAYYPAYVADFLQLFGEVRNLKKTRGLP